MEIKKKIGVKLRPHGATSEPNYTANEALFLRGVDQWKRDTGRRFPTLCEVLDIAESLGWEKQSGDWPSQRPADIEASELACA